MQNATVSRYEGSEPRIVTSVPWSVVMVLGTIAAGPALLVRICRARYAAAACGMA